MFTREFESVREGQVGMAPQQVLRQLLKSHTGMFVERCTAKAWGQVLSTFRQRFERMSDRVLGIPGSPAVGGGPKSMIEMTFQVRPWGAVQPEPAIREL